MGCVFGKESSHVGRKEGDTAAKVEESSRNSKLEEVGESSVAVKEEEGKEKVEEGGHHKSSRESRRRPRQNANPRPRNVPKESLSEQVAAGWPPWLIELCGEALRGWVPRRVDSFEKIDKIGQGTYSNVFKAKDLFTDKIVALKKVRFDNMEPESMRFMAREINILRHLDHPNVVKLQGLAISRMSSSLYLIFEYMIHDLAGLAATPEIKFTESQVKCYMHQLLSGLEHCHSRQVLHRDVKASNLLIDDEGVLKIADFGLASFNPDMKQTMTSRVVTLWYRPPELLLGATKYGVGIDLWSAGCILAELLAGKPIMPGRNEIEQLHRIYKLCGSPSDEYWKKYKLHNPTVIKPREPYRRRIRETFEGFPPSSLPLIETLLAIDPADRRTATDALQSEFFRTEPLACDPTSLPKYPPTKEIDARKRDDEARRSLVAKKAEEGTRKKHPRNQRVRAFPAPEANAELPLNIDRRRMISHGNAKSKSEKFPPPHEDGAVGFPLGASHRIDPSAVPHDIPYSSTSLTCSKDLTQNGSGPLVDPSSSRRKKGTRGKPQEPSKLSVGTSSNQ
ncbi:hypothetical protein SAY87_022510 [Trapa incisa]|uniref:Protein kinase domain-containing protein n=1 Tax=Trapa incisa TaxID=236973 RepID=A0AAN7Q5H7_9MYRT|nr:hypothetical protein SAY87_022510 [Trapa incisa]